MNKRNALKDNHYKTIYGSVRSEYSSCRVVQCVKMMATLAAMPGVEEMLSLSQSLASCVTRRLLQGCQFIN